MADENEEENTNSNSSESESGKNDLESTIKQMSESDELDRSFIVIDSHLWIAHYTVMFLTLLLLLWSFVGSISIQVEGKGVFLGREGLYSVLSKIAGSVEILKVKQGDLVKKGDVIAIVIDHENELKLKLANRRLETMKADLERLRNEINQENANQKEAFLSKIRAAEYNIQATQIEIEGLKKDLDLRQGLVKEGLLSPTNLREIEKELAQKQESLETQKGALTTLNSDLKKGYRTEELAMKEESYLKQQHDRDLLQLTKDYATITSPFDGYVVEVLANQGDVAATGAPIVILEHRKDLESHTSLIVFGFVSVDLGKRLKVGLPVQMEISTVRAEEYGKMIGRIREISEFAVSPEHLTKIIPNPALVTYLVQNNKAVVQIVIEPELDPSTPSGYRWTTTSGSPIPITSGTVCTLQATVEKVKPFYFILPVEQLRNVLYFQNDEPTKNYKDIKIETPLKGTKEAEILHHAWNEEGNQKQEEQSPKQEESSYG